MYTAKERDVIRELAKEYMEISMSEKHQRMYRRFKDSNDLKIVRPPLTLEEELPWNEIDHPFLQLRCTDPRLAQMETLLRQRIFTERHFACDNFIAPTWDVRKTVTNTGYGIDRLIKEDQLLMHGESDKIRSHAYHDVLQDESCVELITDPVITAYPEKDMENLVFAQEIIGDIIPVRLVGCSMVWWSPWDLICQLRGMEPILEDLYERPEYMHALIKRLTEAFAKDIDQSKKLGLYDNLGLDCHFTPGQITGSENPGGCPGWFHTLAQPFATVSPKMHYEFDMVYSIPLASQFAYTYYGCCEPLHDRIEELKHFPNLRKVGCTPWANVEMEAEHLGKDYILSRKPNPANVAVRTDPDIVRKEIEDTVKICGKYGTPLEILLKDVSTINHDYHNLQIWFKAASEVLDAYYGKA